MPPASFMRTASCYAEPLDDVMARAKVTAGGRINLLADIRKKYGLARGGEVPVEDAGDAIMLRTLEQVVTRAQEISRRLIAGHSGASVDDFLIERAREADYEWASGARRLGALALLLGETGGDAVKAVLDAAIMGVVNLAEVVSHYAKLGASRADIEAMLRPPDCEQRSRREAVDSRH